MEALITDMLQILDEHDGDADLEPSLGGGYHAIGQIYDAEDGDDNGIGDQDGLTEQLNGEPSLGWTGDMDQTRAMRRNSLPWPAQLVVDGEQEHDGREPDVDDEDGNDAEPTETDYSYGDYGLDQRTMAGAPAGFRP